MRYNRDALGVPILLFQAPRPKGFSHRDSAERLRAGPDGAEGMNILFIGDIVGRPGRIGVARWLPEVREAYHIDFVVANGENSAGGLGATPDVLRELKGLGIDAFTMGNHVWRKKNLLPAVDEFPEMVRPANYPAGAPGRGSALVKAPNGCTIGIVSVLGRVYMTPLDCPFIAAEREVKALRAQTPIVLVDVHAEATSEKVALGWYLDGRCSAVIGTHTHVQTSDAWILPKGTAYLTDAGMCGPLHSVIGVTKETVLHRFITGMPEKFEVAKGGPLIFNAVKIGVDEKTGRAADIEIISRREPTGS